MPLNWKSQKETEEKILNRPDEIRKMGGHDGDLAKAIESAPDDTGIAIPSDTPAKIRSRKPKQVYQSPQPVAPQISPEEIARLKQVADAQKKIGQDMMKDVAAIPYDVWAFLASDETKALSKEEEKELSDAYFLVAQSLNYSAMSPFWSGMLFLLSRNARLVKARIKSMDELDKTLKEIKDAKK